MTTRTEDDALVKPEDDADAERSSATARLEGAQLEGAQLESAQLEGAQLGGAQLEGAQLEDAERAFDAGDFARLRELVEPLTNSPDPAVAERAKALRARVAVDPLQVAVLVGCALFFLWVVAKYVL